MRIKYKGSLAIFLIFTINIVLLLVFFQFYLKPNLNEIINQTLKEGVLDKIHLTITSDEEANMLIKEIEQSIKDNNARNSISSIIIGRLLIFEVCVLFVLMFLFSTLLYFHYAKPIEKLIQGMDNFSRGIVPSKIGIRRDEIGRLENQFVELTHSVEMEQRVSLAIYF